MIRFNRRRNLRVLSAGMVCVQLAALTAPAFSNPLGGSVVGGGASIDQSQPGLTTINQTTDRAIINWESFGNNAGEAINFVQPGSTSAALNRVTGHETSVINGSMDANGRVFLINPNGIMFGAGSRVNVNGLTASTLDVDNDEFMAGNRDLHFRQDPSRPMGAVINRGEINAREGGVTMVAPLVNNEGSINVQNGGHVRLGAATEAVVPIDERGLVNLTQRAYNDDYVELPEEWASPALQSHTRGGYVGGSVTRENGRARLHGAPGTVMNEGAIRADGAAGRDAGTIRLDSTRYTSARPGSLISASGVGQNSSGGDVRLMSQGTTLFHRGSRVDVKGGETGDGGFMETSGKENILVEGDIDTQAPGGKNGTWLLDPLFLVLVNDVLGAGEHDAPFDGTPPGVQGGDPDSGNNLNQVTDAKINQALSGGSSVILEATAYIKISSGVSIELSDKELFIHSLNNDDSGGRAGISGPGGSSAAINNNGPFGTGKVIFQVDTGDTSGNPGSIDLTGLTVNAKSVYIKAHGNITLDQVRGDLVHVDATGDDGLGTGRIFDTPGASGGEHGVRANLMYLKAAGIGTALEPLEIRTPNLVVDQSKSFDDPDPLILPRNDVYLLNAHNPGVVQAIEVANVVNAVPGNANTFSLENVSGDITVGRVTIPDDDLVTFNEGTFANVNFLGTPPVTGLTVTGANGSNINLVSSAKIFTGEVLTGAGGYTATIQGAGATLSSVKGINPAGSITPIEVGNLSAKNSGTGVAGDIFLEVGDLAPTGPVNVVFDALNTATDGSINLLNTAGDITIGDADVVSAGAVNITAQGASNDIFVKGDVTAGSAHTATLNAGGQILGDPGAGSGLVSAGTVRLIAVNQIGEGARFINTNTRNLKATTTGASGDISVSNTGGTMTVAASSSMGSINVRQNGGKVTIGTVDSTSGLVTGTVNKTVAVQNFGGDIELTAAGTISTNSGDVGLVASGGIALGGTLTTGGTVSGASQVALVAQDGAINQTAGSVIAGDIAMSASGATAGIGAVDRRLDISASRLQLGGLTVGGTTYLNAGNDYLRNNGGVALQLAGSSSTGSIDVLQLDGDLTVTSLTLANFDPLGVDQNPGLVTVGARNGVVTSGQPISLVTGGTMAVNGTITVNNDVLSSGGDIGLVAKGGIALEANVSTGGTANGKLVDLIALNGTITDTNALGTVTSESVALSATGGIGTDSRRLLTSTKNLRVGGLSVNATGTLNGGNSYLANSGGIDLLFGGENVSGNIDLVQTNGKLTVGSVSHGFFDPAGGSNSAAKVTASTRDGITTDDGTIAALDLNKQISLVTRGTTGNRSIQIDKDVKTNRGNIGIFADANVILGANVTTQPDYGTAGNLTDDNVIDIVSINGSITRPSLTGGTVSAEDVLMAATLGIGAADRRVVTSTQTLKLGDVLLNPDIGSNIAVVNGGDDYLSNIGQVNLTFAAENDASNGPAGNIDLIQTDANLIVGALTTGEFDPAGANDSAVEVTTANRAGIFSNGPGKTVSLVTLDATLGLSHDITIDEAISTSNGSVGIVAAEGIVLDADINTAGNANGRLVDLIAMNGKITRPVYATGGTVTAENVAMSSTAVLPANAGIGAADRRVRTSTKNLKIGDLTVALDPEGDEVASTPIVLDNKGHDYVENTGDVALTLAAVNTSGGNIDVTQTNANLTIGGLGIGGFNPASPKSAAKVTSTSLTLNGVNAQDGSVSLVTLGATGTRNILVNQAIQSTNGSIGLIAANGIVLDNDVTTGSATDGDLIDLIAMNGQITRPFYATGGTVTAGNVAMSSAHATTASAGIGAADKRVRTSTSNLKIGDLTVAVDAAGDGTAIVTTPQTNNGNDYIENQGTVPMILAAVTANGNVDVVNTDANLTIDSLAIGAFDPAEPGVYSATAPNSAVKVTAVNRDGVVASNGSISLVTLNTSGLAGSRDILVNKLVSATTGNIGIISAEDLQLDANVTAGLATGTQLIDLIAMNGKITRPDYTDLHAVTAGNVAMSSTAVAATDAGIGAADKRVRTATSNLRIGDLTVDIDREGDGGPVATVQVNKGHDFVENTTGVAMNLSAINQSGNIDITQTDADLIIDTLGIGAFDPGEPSPGPYSNVAPNSVVKVSASSGNLDGVTAQDGSISLVTLGSAGTPDILVNKAITATNGNIGIIAAEGIRLDANVTAGLATGTQLIDLIARNGQITRPNYVTGGTVTAGNIAMSSFHGTVANAGIGAADKRVRTSTSNLKIGDLTLEIDPEGDGAPASAPQANTGSDFIENQGSVALKVAATSASGNIDIVNTDADLTIDSLAIGAFDPAEPVGPYSNLAPNSAVKVTAVNRDGIAAGNGSISLVSLNAGGVGSSRNVVISKDITATAGDIGIISAQGIELNANLTAGLATGTQLIDLIAMNGKITRPNYTTGGTVTAGNVGMSSTATALVDAGIGAADKRVRTATSNLRIGEYTVAIDREGDGGPVSTPQVNKGDDFVENTTGVNMNLAAINQSGNIDVVNTDAEMTVTTLGIGSFDPGEPPPGPYSDAGPNSVVKVTTTSGNLVGVTAQNGSISLVTLNTAGTNSRDIYVDQAISATNGDIGIISAEGIELDANVTTGGSGNARLIDLIAMNGKITRPDYTDLHAVTSGRIAMSSTAAAATDAGIGAANMRVRTATSNLRIGDLSVAIDRDGDGAPAPVAVAQINKGHDFVENTTGVDLILAAVNQSGNIDITQTDADLTVGTQGIGAFDPSEPGPGPYSTAAPNSVVKVTTTGGNLDGVTAQDGSISLVTLGSAGTPNIFVNKGISATNGDIGIIAAEGIELAANVTAGLATGTQLIDLIAMNGKITRPSYTTGGTITAGNIAMSSTHGTPASAGIGAADKRVRTSTSNLKIGDLTVAIDVEGDGAPSSVPQSNTGSDYIENQGGIAMKVVATSASGNIDIVNTDAEMTIDSLAIGGFDPAEPAGPYSNVAPNSAAKVTAANRDGIAAGNGSISLVTLNTAGTNSRDIYVKKDITATGGNIGIISAEGIELDANVTAGLAGGSQLIDLIAMNGKITRPDYTDLHAVTAGNVAMSSTAVAAADAGIGAADKRVRTATSNLRLGDLTVAIDREGDGAPITTTAQVNKGHDFVENTTGQALTLAAINQSGNIDVTQTNADLTIDTLGIGAFDPAEPGVYSAVAPNSVVKVTASSGNLDGVTAQNGSISLVTLGSTGSQDILVNKAISATSGNIGIIAAEGIRLDANVTAGLATGTQLIDLIALNGKITRPDYTDAHAVTAGNVAMSSFHGTAASAGIGEANQRVRTSTSNLKIGDLAVAVDAEGDGVAIATPVMANTGSDFVENQGGVALKVAARSASGNIDIVNTDADLTIDSLAIGDFDPGEPAGVYSTAAPNSAVKVTATNRDGISAGSGSISLVTLSTAGTNSRDILVKKDISATGGNIGIISAKGIELDANVTAGTSAGGQLIDLVAMNGKITRPDYTDAHAVTAGSVAMSSTAVAVADAGIGEANKRVRTSTSNLRIGDLTVDIDREGDGGPVTTAQENKGNDFVENRGATATTLAAINANGNIDVTQLDGDLTIGSQTIGNFDPAVPNSVAKITPTNASTVGVTTQAGSISLATLTPGAGSRDIVVNENVRATGGDIGIVAAEGIELNADVDTGSASDQRLIDLIAMNGKITRPDLVNGGKVRAGSVAISSTAVAAGDAGIGSATRRVMTETSHLKLGDLTAAIDVEGDGTLESTTALVNKGHDYLQNQAAVLTLAANNQSGNVDVLQIDNDLIVGTEAIGAFDPGEPAGAYSAAAPNSAVKITAASRDGISADAGAISIVTDTVVAGPVSRDIRVTQSISGPGGDIGIVAAHDVALGANVSTGSSSNGRLLDVVARNGAITRTAGTVTSGNMAMAATNGIGLLTERVETSTSNLQFGGLAVNGSGVVNGGGQFVRNSGPTALTLAGNSVSGSMDVLQDGALLTVGASTLGDFDPASPADSAAEVTATLQDGLTLSGNGQMLTLETVNAGDVAFSNVVTNANGLVVVNSVASIVNNRAGANDITADETRLTAQQSIGTAASPFGVDTPVLLADAITGDVFINSYRAPQTLLTGHSGSNFTFTQVAGDLSLVTVNAGLAINLAAPVGNILNGAPGGGPNIVSSSGSSHTLSAGGSLGTRDNPLDIALDPGFLTVIPGGTDPSGAAVNITGIISPDVSIRGLGASTPIQFNGRSLTGPELTVFRAGTSVQLDTMPDLDEGLSGVGSANGSGTTAADLFGEDDSNIQMGEGYLEEHFVEEETEEEANRRRLSQQGGAGGQSTD